LETIQNTLNYVGAIPSYGYFEPRRTTIADYGENTKACNFPIFNEEDTMEIGPTSPNT